MSGVPPTSSSGGPSRSGRSEEPSESKKSKKAFSLPKRDREKEEKKGKGEEVQKKPIIPKKESEGVAEQEVGVPLQAGAASAGVQPGSAAAGITKIGQIISKLIAELYSGTLGGNQITSMALKATSEIPTAFQGVNLTIVQTNAGLVVNFSQFATPQQMADAITLVEKNKEQLSEMVRVLAAKNITIAEFQVGNTQIALPRVERTSPLAPPPIRGGESMESWLRRQREQEKGGEREEGGEPEER